MRGATAAIACCFAADDDAAIVVPVLDRPPLPLPMPDPVRDAAVWATVLPWDVEPPPGLHLYSPFHGVRRDRHRGTRRRVKATAISEHGAPTSRDYLRGDAWGVVMPDAPMIDGANAKTKDQILSWFMDRYPLDFQKQYLEKYAGYGYTHLYFSPPDSLNGAAKTLDEFVATCRLVRSYGLYVGLNMASKYFQPSLMEPDSVHRVPRPAARRAARRGRRIRTRVGVGFVVYHRARRDHDSTALRATLSRERQIVLVALRAARYLAGSPTAIRVGGSGFGMTSKATSTGSITSRCRRGRHRNSKIAWSIRCGSSATTATGTNFGCGRTKRRNNTAGTRRPTTATRAGTSARARTITCAGPTQRCGDSATVVVGRMGRGSDR